jgi:hypothetical protein
MLDQVMVEAPPERLRLGSRLVRRSDLPPRDVSRMRELLDRHFAGVDASTFAADLASKNYVVLLDDAAGALRGFTTFHMGATRVGGRPITVVYSGDTIVDPVAWGSPVLPRAWIHAVYDVRSEFPAGDLYWLLLTSGFRTYRFLSVFWKHFYPRHDTPTPAAAQELLDALGRARYGAQYDGAAGVGSARRGADSNRRRAPARRRSTSGSALSSAPTRHRPTDARTGSHRSPPSATGRTACPSSATTRSSRGCSAPRAARREC